MHELTRRIYIEYVEDISSSMHLVLQESWVSTLQIILKAEVECIEQNEPI